MCFSCFSQIQPRYKRLVNDIFPALPQDGLIKSNMEKLMFYAVSSPEKLDRIGEYLYQRASRDISCKRESYVKIAMEAMDQLLAACHSQTLNLFVESFLRMVQKLLECSEPELQILATQSFVKFANIKEDTPSYHLCYNFFIEKFSSMCHNNSNNPSIREGICLAGIKGLQGVICKTVSDDLVENIWEPVHMDKIIPSLLYNMQNPRYKGEEEILMDNVDPKKLLNCNETEEKDPAALAESCFRELMGRASFGHVKSVIRPVLRHFDLHKLWTLKSFAIHCFRLIMFSIQSQYLYTVVESLLVHLDENTKLPSKVRTNVADVLSKIIAIAAGESIGPTVLEIINSLLTHLHTSITGQSSHRMNGGCDAIDEDEKNYQEALILALGEFSAHLPNYQKIEIMMFIMSKIVQSKTIKDFNNIDNRIQHICLKSLLMVCSKYSSIHMTATLPQSFLDPLLCCSHVTDPQIRLLVQQVLHTLFDCHGNGAKFSKPLLDYTYSGLIFEKCSRSDTIFMSKNGPEIYTSLCESLEHNNNTIDNVEAIYKTMALLCVKLTSEETIGDFFNAVMNIQDLALSNDSLPQVLKYQLHTIVICLLSLVGYVYALLPLREFVNTIIDTRKEAKALHLLPELCIHYEIVPEHALPTGVLVNQALLVECLNQAGIDITRLVATENGTVSGGGGAAAVSKHLSLTHCHSWVENLPISNLSDVSFHDFNSSSSSPCFERRFPAEDLTFEAMKRAFTESAEKDCKQEAVRRAQIFEQYKSLSFVDLMNLCSRNEEETIPYKLGKIFMKLNADGSVNTPVKVYYKQKDCYQPMLESLFPECFVY
ncbi:hypothetical protein V9T40_012688 [Parthenolecanium corni]|uniref:Uncharacterized protein n=1 Tax=Parthenolecanium corni TaxID=536013 RepID=A0AAN9TKU7_9HEMI